LAAGANFLGERIKADALTIAQLVEQAEAKDARIAELEKKVAELEKERTP
jgi:uncharacterized protein HemX